MEELIIHLEFAKILAIIAIGAIIITIISYIIARKNRVVKYIPGLILIILGVYNLFYLGQDTSTIEGFNRLYVVIISMISGFIGLSTGLIIGILTKDKN